MIKNSIALLFSLLTYNSPSIVFADLVVLGDRLLIGASTTITPYVDFEVANVPDGTSNALFSAPLNATADIGTFFAGDIAAGILFTNSCGPTISPSSETQWQPIAFIAFWHKYEGSSIF